MTREARSIFLVGITLFLYALIGFIKEGAILFPFQLRDFALFIVVVQYIFWFHKDKTTIFTLGIGSLLGVLGHPLFLETIFPTEEYEKIMLSDEILYVKYISLSLVLLWAIIFIIRQKNILSISISLIGLSLIILGFLSNMDVLIYTNILGYLLLVISAYKYPSTKPFHLIWSLFLMFEVVKLLSFG
ncbi:MAG: hypothetical protein QNK23_08370 [Crocinitomicaceae bacterium]|nr:hypothetical protein [Crocinitomicaceae bacterium]